MSVLLYRLLGYIVKRGTWLWCKSNAKYATVNIMEEYMIVVCRIS